VGIIGVGVISAVQFLMTC